MSEREAPGPVVVELLDTDTGQRVRTKPKFIAFWWAEGNGSCDCNRRVEFPGLISTGGRYCDGARRFLITDVTGDLDGYRLAEFNRDYSVELRKKWGLP